MNRFKTLYWILPLVGLMGCISTYRITQWDTRSMELTRIEYPEQGTKIFELQQRDDDNKLTLLIRSEQITQRPELGITLEEIDKNLAQEKMLTPYSGLFVRDIKSGGAAANAGLLPGDIVTTVNGTDVLYMELYDHLLQNGAPEEPVTVTVSRGFEQKQTRNLSIKPTSKQVVLPSTKAVPLEGPQIDGPTFAGIETGTLPEEWTEVIYGDRRSTVLIGRVVVGSPAYIAGLRGGDRILSVNDRHFETATALKTWILDQGSREETVRFEVFKSKTGPFSTEVELERTDTSSEVVFPFIFNLEDDVRRTDWDFGPFGIICNYNGRYMIPNTRDTNYKREISCVLGLIRYSWTPEKSRLRLLWFISFGSE